MMRKFILLLAAMAGMYLSPQAQTQPCGFDQVHKQLLSSSPVYSQRVAANNAKLAQILQNSANSLIINTPGGPVYDIPVVIHVIHTGGAINTIYNPTDATLQGMITYLNQAYAATYASYPGPTTGGTYFPVQFSLAKRDPNCNATTGIERINGSSALGTTYTTYGVKLSGTNGVADATLKALSNWDNNDYYNIWVVNRIDGNDGTVGTFTAGYAYFPGAPATIDGCVMLATQSTTGKPTIVHEIGHAFNLYHVFEDDDPGNTGAATTCPSIVASACATTGDLVCDTEPMKRSVFNCPSGTNPCTGVAWQNTQYNFMDYSNCKDRFTGGQKTRWMNALTTLRQSLISSLGATTLGTPPTASNCQPTMPFPFLATTDAGVYEVKLNDMDATSEGGFVSDGNLEYVDRACRQRANLTAGVSYTISVLTGPNREYVRVYMDYNNDGVFSTTTELVYSHNGSTGSAGQYEVHTGSFLVPTTGITTCNPIRMRVISDAFASAATAGPCTALTQGQAEDFSVVIKPAPPSIVTVALASGFSNPSCNGTNVGLTASYSGTPVSPTLRWYVNGVATAVTGTSYASSAFVNGDVVTAKLFFTGACGSDSTSSAAFTIIRQSTVTPTISIAVTAGSNPGCFGQSITFGSTTTNAGVGPSYQWYIGTTPIVNPGASYTTTTLPCNSNVSVVLTSSSTCVSTTTATSNTINYTCGTQAIGVNIAVTGGSNPTCQGRTVTFAATPVNGGPTPAYQWFVNGAAVSGATGTTFSTNTLANGDSVTVQLTSSFSCAATPNAMSAAVYMIVIPNVTPTVTKAITIGSNPGCINDPIQFTATAANAGAAPAYRWYLNGLPITGAVTNVYTTSTTVTGDKIWVRIVASGASSACYARDSAYSDTTIMDRRPVPQLPVISFIGHYLVSDSADVQWYGPAGLITGATGQTYRPTAQGNYYARIISPLCGTGTSNVLIVSPLMVGNYHMNGVAVYPNPTSGQLTITWAAPATTRITVYTPLGQAVLHDIATVSTRKVIDLSQLAAGVYFVTLQDEHGESGTVRVTVTH